MFYNQILKIETKGKKVLINMHSFFNDLNRRDKQVATSSALSAFGCAVSWADTVSSFLGHCYHISICLFLDQGSGSHSKKSLVLRTILLPTVM